VAQHIVITAAGTGSDMWNTAPPQPAAVAQALNPSLCYWQPLGNYPASVANPQMGQSVQEGVNECVRLLNDVYPTNSIIPLGYSQGAIVVSHFIRDEVLNPQGRCFGRAKDIVAVATWGNPCRPPGFASGNQFAGWPLPADVDGVTTGGIAGPDCLTADQVNPHLLTPVTHFWGDFVNTIGQGNDLYADCPTGPTPATSEAGPGALETQIYNIVQDANFTNLFAIALDIFKLFGPGLFTQALSIAEAIINGGMFLAAGPNAAHYTYDITPIVNFINLAASQTAPWA
jgi:hypothetical protein